MVTFNPYYSYSNYSTFAANVLGPEIVNTYQQPYGNSMIMDLKDGNVFEFECPYVSRTPYVNYYSSMGAITVVCMDPLKSTGTVTPTVPLLVEVCGGTDFELADFAGVPFPLLPSGTIYVQSGGTPIKDTIKEPSSITMGDRVMSAKQLIQVPHPFRYTTIATTDKFFVPPWFTNPTYLNANALKGLPNAVNSTNSWNGGNTVGGTLSKCYAFVKGGTDVHVYNTQVTTILRCAQSAKEYGADNNFAPAALDYRVFQSSTPSVISASGIPLHVRLPAFQTVARIPSTAYDDKFSGYLNSAISAPKPYLTHFSHFVIDTTGDTVSDETVTFHVGASDDASMAHYYGPVPIFIPNTLNTTPFDSDSNLY